MPGAAVQIMAGRKQRETKEYPGTETYCMSSKGTPLSDMLFPNWPTS